MPHALLAIARKVFHLQVPHDVTGGGKVEGTIAVTRQKENVRLVSTAVYSWCSFLRFTAFTALEKMQHVDLSPFP